LTKTKTKKLAQPAAQTREEVEQLIASIGVSQRELLRLEADLGDVVAKAKEKAEEAALPLKQAIVEAEDRISQWCQANRAALTREGKVKFAKFSTGLVSWRDRPASVSVRGKVEAVLAWLLENKGRKFIRTKLELNKEALLANRAFAETVPGVTIKSAGEDFTIEPHSGELVEAA